MFDMEFLQCPYCRKNVRGFLYILTFPGLMKKTTCKHCNKRIKINLKTVKHLLYFFLVGLIVGKILSYIFPSYPVIFLGIFFLFVIAPILLDYHLFATHEEENL